MNTHKNSESTAVVKVEAGKTRPLTEQIFAPLKLTNYSHFLFQKKYGGKPEQIFTAHLETLVKWVKAVC